ncbi:MAG: acyl-ACP desaturase, partial [Acidobacteria bacterium]|nr:acyl-ACP desaturase [Acidobacteriota bacterium]
MFETEREVLAWYERQPRAINRSFLESIPWEEVSRHELRAEFIPVLLYMRDVESFTDIYYKELQRTPTGKDPVIKQFMERWSGEEQDHADLLNRFLAEAGVPVSPRWEAEEKAKIPFRYTLENYIAGIATKPFGDNFAGAHMAWGAINELTTLQGYQRLWKLAGHPVLENILRTIAREESVHVNFYWHVARLKLARSPFAQKLARYIIGKFWTPVGQGTKPTRETNYLIATLFKGVEGISFFDRKVNNRVEQLPGFSEFKNITDRVRAISMSDQP